MTNDTLIESIAKRLHYPEHWDTAAYPTINDAINELAGCIGCSECKQGGIRPDADQKPNSSDITVNNKYSLKWEDGWLIIDDEGALYCKVGFAGKTRGEEIVSELNAMSTMREASSDINFITIEIYDDEIRYGGKTIWRGIARNKSPEEVDAIVKAYLNTKIEDGGRQ